MAEFRTRLSNYAIGPQGCLCHLRSYLMTAGQMMKDSQFI
ncbi:hypothetical protein C7S16_5092 [Burkholderia thailandensis]|uniref:Uncharacterized protein n=1 Tax=Burkholderia thailandensis TaxID=57975 RepID=A0AAW9CNS5_BURTH|nr:hypothetical protein [Burkholderia thailandensis]